MFGLFNIKFILKVILFIIFAMFGYMAFQDNFGLGILVTFIGLMLYLQFKTAYGGRLHSGTGGGNNRQNGFAPQNENQGLDIMLRLMELEAQNRNTANNQRNQRSDADATAERKPVYLSEEHRLMRKIFEVE
jgi:hypothetical protein